MVSNKTDYIFREINSRGLGKTIISKPTIPERIDTLNYVVMEMNITKCSLSDLDIDRPGSVHHLVFLIQDMYKVDMGICPFYKMWYNKNGQQNRCRFNKGPVQVDCSGYKNMCEHKQEYAEYDGKTFDEIINGLKK
ncbi:hypothetical protein HYZ41_03685 [archaeon]|nr:hypothetical protein [archaeon]